MAQTSTTLLPWTNMAQTGTTLLPWTNILYTLCHSWKRAQFIFFTPFAIYGNALNLYSLHPLPFVEMRSIYILPTLCHVWKHTQLLQSPKMCLSLPWTPNNNVDWPSSAFLAPAAAGISLEALAAAAAAAPLAAVLACEYTQLTLPMASRQ